MSAYSYIHLSRCHGWIIRGSFCLMSIVCDVNLFRTIFFGYIKFTKNVMDMCWKDDTKKWTFYDAFADDWIQHETIQHYIIKNE